MKLDSRWFRQAPSGLFAGIATSAFILGHFTLIRMLLLPAMATSGREGLSPVVVNVQAAGFAAGHLVECALFLTAVVIAAALWRGTAVRGKDVAAAADAIGQAHVLLLVWLVAAMALWLPRTFEAVRLGIPPSSLTGDVTWVSASVLVYFLRSCAEISAVGYITFVLGRRWQLGLLGSLVVVILPALVVTGGAWLLILLRA